MIQQQPRGEDTQKVAKYHRGFLFVHGIGEQQQGETLVGFGEPMFQWLEEWFRRNRSAEDPKPTLRYMSVEPRPMEEGAIPHAVLEFCADSSVSTPPESWLVAESCWAKTVQPPRFGPLAKWLLTRGTWMILSHFRQSGSESRRVGAVRQILLEMFVGIPLALSMQAAVLVLSVLAAIPVPALHKVISGTLLRLSGFLGDSYVFVHSRWQREAILQQVREDLGWMRQQCEHVAIIAHSQGAAVSLEVLRRLGKSPAEILVTFGSGVQKLEELREVEETSPQICWKVAAMVGALPLIWWLAMRQLTAGQPDPWSKPGGWMVPFWLLGVGLAVWLKMGKIQEKLRERLSKGIVRENGEPLTWLDVPASHDPVSHGPLPGAAGTVPGYECAEVANRESLLSDHTTYWQNTCEFVPRVWRKIDKEWKLGLISNSSMGELEDLEARHKRRVHLISTFSGASLGAMVLLLFPAAWNVLQTMADSGKTVSRFVIRLTPDGLERAVARLGEQFQAPGKALAGLLGEVSILAGFWTLMPEILRDALARPGLMLLGAAPMLLLVLLWQKLLLTVWVHWDEADWKRFIRGEPASRAADIGIPILLALGAVLPAAAVVLGMMPALWPGWLAVEHGVHVGVAWLVVACLAATGLIFAGLGVGSLAKGLKAGKGTVERSEQTKLVGGALLLCTIMVFALAEIMPGPLRERLSPHFGLRGIDPWKILGPGAALATLIYYAVQALKKSRKKLEESWGKLPGWLLGSLFVVPAVTGAAICGAVWTAMSAVQDREAAMISLAIMAGVGWSLGLRVVGVIARFAGRTAR